MFEIWVPPLLTCPIIEHCDSFIFVNICSCLLVPAPLSCSLPTANPGEQPDQPCEEEQWTGEPNGQTDSDLSAGRGKKKKTHFSLAFFSWFAQVSF